MDTLLDRCLDTMEWGFHTRPSLVSRVGSYGSRQEHSTKPNWARSRFVSLINVGSVFSAKSLWYSHQRPLSFLIWISFLKPSLDPRYSNNGNGTLKELINHQLQLWIHGHSILLFVFIKKCRLGNPMIRLSRILSELLYRLRSAVLCLVRSNDRRY